MYVLISSLSTRAATHRLMYAKKKSDFRISTWNVDCQPTASYTQIQNMAFIFANLNTTQILWLLQSFYSLASMLHLFLDATSLLGIRRHRTFKLCTDREHDKYEEAEKWPNWPFGKFEMHAASEHDVRARKKAAGSKRLPKQAPEMQCAPWLRDENAAFCIVSDRR